LMLNKQTFCLPNGHQNVKKDDYFCPYGHETMMKMIENKSYR
jgi:hypothetical protein